MRESRRYARVYTVLVVVVVAGAMYYYIFVDRENREMRNHSHMVSHWQQGNISDEEILPQLYEGMHSSNGQIHVWSVRILAQMGAKAVPTLIEGLSDARDEVRIGSAGALAMMGPAAAPATSALIQALEDGNPHVRGYAAAALGQIGAQDEAARAALARVRDNQGEEPGVRQAARVAIEQIEQGDSYVAAAGSRDGFTP